MHSLMLTKDKVLWSGRYLWLLCSCEWVSPQGVHSVQFLITYCSSLIKWVGDRSAEVWHYVLVIRFQIYIFMVTFRIVVHMNVYHISFYNAIFYSKLWDHNFGCMFHSRNFEKFVLKPEVLNCYFKSLYWPIYVWFNL